MIGRIWRGEIGLAWAFWGVGLLGLYPLIALLLGSVSLGWLAGDGSQISPYHYSVCPSSVLWQRGVQSPGDRGGAAGLDRAHSRHLALG